MAAQRGNNHESSQSATHERVSEIHSSMGPVGAFDNSPLHLTVENLNGKNNREWAQAIKLVIDGKGKLGLLTGETRRPPPTDVAASQKWQSENSFITSCLINSMKLAIGKTYMFLPTAKDMKQGDREVTEYYTEMLGLWQDLDLSCEEEWECTGDSVCFKKKMENERVFEFLAGLNREFDDVRSKVLSHRPLSSIREVFSEVRREESRRRVMLDLSFGPEGSALLTHRPHTAAGRGPHAAGSSGPSPRQSKRTYCEHCKKLGHTKDTCWALHGKPANWKPRQPNKAHSNQASTETRADKTPTEICQSTSSVRFNSDQLAKLYELFFNFQTSGQSSTTLSSGSLAKKGTFLTVLSTMSQITPWIIDSGASDHMTNAHHLFSTHSF
ncbi:hypothetical protein PVL29_008861 [Vitis rotundifolia]|uniref:Retrotransposon Copia-like N-terminal domain-containing protein n=1 Tax=Vitis rotundifolia TaxID=103349 RepID=A0AA38ZXR7_VITRO|nr:hypothetical protein PVL29_008861 [Vitis rotundifolia]